VNLLETSDCRRRLCGIRVAFVSFSWRSHGVRVACSEAAWRSCGVRTRCVAFAWRSHGPPFFPVTCPLRSRGVPPWFLWRTRGDRGNHVSRSFMV